MLTFRFATPDDAPEIAALNQQAIKDEGSTNPMTLPELEVRMRGFLGSVYTAVLFHDDDATVAYVLYRDDENGIYLRQFFVVRERRRQGIGREAFQLLRSRILAPGTRIVLEVLIKNERAQAFWGSVGFVEYARTYELCSATMPKKKAKKKPPKKSNAASARARALHKRASNYNWDDGVAGLQKILDNAACDGGTALLIYWMGAPGFDQQYKTAKQCDSWRRETFVFLRALERRLLARDFKTYAILFNPRLDRSTLDSEGHDWTAEYDDVKVLRPIPPELHEPSRDDPTWKPGKTPSRRVNRLT